ncbi:multidrug MFS transporter [Pandoraea captiosa]|uniref:Multidrug MFS transporter n=2 Tax=Pandoraea captiosa TaxID=2508302 RepID=A0A5E5A1V9_9BURK|nr:multidrug MFS transporter [Pandoraea captiosa]
MIAISLAVGMATLDTAITNTALPTISASLLASGPGVIWVVTSYQLAMVAAMLPLAAICDVRGHRPVFLLGLFLFIVSSFACGAAWSLPALIAARAIQGLGAAALMAANTALVRHLYPENELGRGLGINAAVIALGVAAGPTVASAVLSFATWHWLFFINVPAGAVALALAWRLLPASMRSTRTLDVPGALLCALTFALFLYGIGGYAQGASLWSVIIEVSLSVLLGWALIRRQRRSALPLLAVDLLRLPIFSLSAVAALFAFVAQGLAMVALPFFFQRTLGVGQVETGLLLTPWPAVGGLMAPVAGRMADRFSAGLLGGMGMLFLALGIVVLAMLPAGAAHGLIIACMMICGFGFGLFLSPNQRTLMGSVPRTRSGAASGVLGIARILGQAVGAILVALHLRVLGPVMGPNFALWVGAGFAGAAAVASVLRLVAGAPRG